MPDGMWSVRVPARDGLRRSRSPRRETSQIGPVPEQARRFWVGCGKPVALNLVLKVHIRQSRAVEQYDLSLGLAEEAKNTFSVEI